MIIIMLNLNLTKNNKINLINTQKITYQPMKMNPIPQKIK
jgi:hypothetical protein